MVDFVLSDICSRTTCSISEGTLINVNVVLLLLFISAKIFSICAKLIISETNLR